MSEDKKISEMDLVAANASGDVFPMLQGGANYRTTLSKIQTYLQDNMTLGITQAGVYLVKVNGEIIRYDDTSDTPIQDAINAAVKDNVGGGSDLVVLANYCNYVGGRGNGKQEQNIILKDDINLLFLGSGKLYSDSTDDTPLFTDNGTQVQVFFLGYCNFVRYGGAGTNNRCAVKLTNASSEVYFPDFVVADTSTGSTNSFDIAGSINIGNGFWTGAITISGGTNIINVDPHYAPNVNISGGTTYWNGRFGNLGQSNGTLRIVGNGASINQSGGVLYLSNGTVSLSSSFSAGQAYLSNMIFKTIAVSSSADVHISNSIIGESDNEAGTQVNVSGGTIRLVGCQIFGSDTSNPDPGYGIQCTNGTCIVDSTTIVMEELYSGGINSILQSGGGVVKNYFSISNTATSGTIGIAALTVNASVT